MSKYNFAIAAAFLLASLNIQSAELSKETNFGFDISEFTTNSPQISRQTHLLLIASINSPFI